MKALFELIEEHLIGNDVHYEKKPLGNEPYYDVPFRGSNVCMRCGVCVCEEERRLSISVFSGVTTRPERLQAVYELVARINCGIVIGAFVVDEDGDVSYRLVASALDIETTDKWIGGLIGTAICAYDHFLPAISCVIYADVAPAEALARLADPSYDEVTESVMRLLGSDDTPTDLAAEDDGQLQDGSEPPSEDPEV